MADTDALKIMALNDLARQSFTGCRVVITEGVQAMENVPDLLDQVRWYDQFTPDEIHMASMTLARFVTGVKLSFGNGIITTWTWACIHPTQVTQL
jgi:hypothetical protein